MRSLPVSWSVGLIALVTFAVWDDRAIADGEIGAGSALTSTAGSSEPVRTWTSASGRKARAKFVRYDEAQGTVRFQLPDGRAAATPLRNLGKADREYLAKKLLSIGGMSAPDDLPPPFGDDALRIQMGRLVHLSAAPAAIAKHSTPVVLIRGASRQAESLPTPFGPVDDAAKVSPRHAFYGCRGTHHLVGLTGTVSYQYHHRWWLTALTAVLPTDPEWLYYNEEQWPFRRWAIRRRATFCCKHAVFIMSPYGMWEFFHYADAVRMAPR